MKHFLLPQCVRLVIFLCLLGAGVRGQAQQSYRMAKAPDQQFNCYPVAGSWVRTTNPGTSGTNRLTSTDYSPYGFSITPRGDFASSSFTRASRMT